MANSLVCHANHVLSVAAIRKAHLSTAGPDLCNRCVRASVGGCLWVCVFMHVGGSGSLYSMCELVKGTRFLRQCCFYLLENKKRNPYYACPACKFIFVLGGRCVGAAERGVCGTLWLSVRTVWLVWWVPAIPPHPQSNQTTIIWYVHKHKHTHRHRRRDIL